jgi:hypothetical protein
MTISISRFISIRSVTILTTLLGIFTSSNSLAAEMSSFQLNKPVRIELGSGAVLDPDRLEIRVVGINDLRCPKSNSSDWVVSCYWGGEAQVKLNLSQAEKNLGDLDLTLGTINPEYFYPNNIKQVGKYYIRLLEIAPHRVAFPPNERNKVAPNKVMQTVTLQVQKTPFKLKDANLDPRQQPRPLNPTPLGKRFALFNNQSLYHSKLNSAVGNLQNSEPLDRENPRSPFLKPLRLDNRFPWLGVQMPLELESGMRLTSSVLPPDSNAPCFLVRN